MDNTNDHHDNPEFILKGWEDGITGKFYLIYFNPKSNKVEIELTSSSNKILRTRGFHPSIIDSQFIQPSETAFSSWLIESSFPELNYLIKIPSKIDNIISFCVRQAIGGTKFKRIAQQSYSDFPNQAKKRITSNHPEIPPDKLCAEIDRLLPGYTKALTYESIIPAESNEYKIKLESMKCWALHINMDVGHFITGSTPFFQQSEGDNFTNLYCIKRLFFPISPNLYIIFVDNKYGFGKTNPITFSDIETKKIIEHFNIDIFKRCDDYIISRKLPFIGYEYFLRLKLEIDNYLNYRQE